MIKCGICNGQTATEEKVVRVVLETRPATYPYRNKVHRYVKDGKVEWNDDPGGKGQEIVREVLAHKECAPAD